MTRRKNPDSVLAHALIAANGEGDDRAARRFGLEPADIVRARRRSVTDPEFRLVVGEARRAIERTWRTDCAAATAALSRELMRRATDPDGASTIEIVAALRASGELIVTASSMLLDDGLEDDLPRAHLLPRGEA